jgi:hypothetical protein
MFGCSDDKNKILPDSKLIHDDNYHFSIRVPNDWEVKTVEGKGTTRLIALNTNTEKQLSVHVLKAKGKVDLKKLSNVNQKIYKNVGILSDTINKPLTSPWLLDSSSIIKIYKKDRMVSLFHNKSQGSYGFIAVLRGDEKFVEEFKLISNTFSNDVPVSETIRPGLNSLLAIILASFLGASGLKFRKSIITKKLIRNIKKNIDRKPSAHLMRKYFTNQFLIILLPIGCVLIYSAGCLFLLPNMKYIFIWAGPFLPICGYFGIVRNVDDGDIPLKL